jgi:DNA ligase-associated metallophosphoesterase
MPATPILFRGETLLLDPAGILVWPRLSLLAVADLHLEKGSASARRGQLVPPWDSALTLARLAPLIATYAPTTLVALGDSFHDDHAAARLSPPDLTHLAHLTTQTRFIWVRGNHDPSPPEGIAGLSTPAYELENITFRHQAHPTATGEISGHFHPKARIATRAAEIARPCFMLDGTRIILPSFGAYTGGLNIAHPAIASLFPSGGQAYLLAEHRVFCFSVPAVPTEAALPPCPPTLVTTRAAAKFPL